MGRILWSFEPMWLGDRSGTERGGRHSGDFHAVSGRKIIGMRSD